MDSLNLPQSLLLAISPYVFSLALPPLFAPLPFPPFLALTLLRPFLPGQLEEGVEASRKALKELVTRGAAGSKADCCRERSSHACGAVRCKAGSEGAAGGDRSMPGMGDPRAGSKMVACVCCKDRWVDPPPLGGAQTRGVVCVLLCSASLYACNERMQP